VRAKASHSDKMGSAFWRMNVESLALVTHDLGAEYLSRVHRAHRDGAWDSAAGFLVRALDGRDQVSLPEQEPGTLGRGHELMPQLVGAGVS